MPSKKKQQIAAFIFGIVFLLICIGIALLFPNPTQFQYLVFRITLSLATAGIASMIPGFLEVEFQPIIRAGGALGVFCLVYMANPAALVSEPLPPDVENARNLKQEVMNVRGYYESMPYDEAPSARNEVQSIAGPKADALKAILDKNTLPNADKIDACRYSAWGYAMAAEAAYSKDATSDYASRSLTMTQKALQLISQTTDPKTLSRLKSWQYEEKIKHIRVIAAFLLAKIDKMSDVEVQKYFLEISPSYRDAMMGEKFMQKCNERYELLGERT